MAKVTKQRIGAKIAQIVRARRLGKPFKSGRKDGGVPTKSIVPCPDIPEAEVLSDCISWLRRHRFAAWRMNVTAMDMDGAGIRQYGIKGAGDILCIYEGRYIEIECKRGRGGVLSLNQQKHREQVLRHNGLYLVVHGVAELRMLLKASLFKRKN